MEFVKPNEKGFTIYSKSGCPYCDKVKSLLEEEQKEYIVVDCDSYIETPEKKELFLLFIEGNAAKPYKTFPMVFSEGKFLGGYMDTLKVIMDLNDDI